MSEAFVKTFKRDYVRINLDLLRKSAGFFALSGGLALEASMILAEIEGGARACAVAFGLQPHAHDAEEDESQKADHGVGADAIGQAVVNRRDLDVGFQDAEANAAVDVFVATCGVKDEKAVAKLTKDRDVLLALHDFPAEHWKHIRTTNP